MAASTAPSENATGAPPRKQLPPAAVGEAIAELSRLRARLTRDARALGLATAAAGMHPGKMTEEPQVPPAGRYQFVHRTMRGIARREPTFALHVHIGVADPESAIQLLNRLRAHLPLLLALSATSPLWQGRTTGLASNRTILFQAFPRTGLPRCNTDTAPGGGARRSPRTRPRPRAPPSHAARRRCDGRAGRAPV